MEETQGIQPWEQKKGESRQAYEAFLAYRDMGADRSLRKVSEQLAKSEPLMKRWSSRWSWRNRVADFERHMDREETKALVAGRTAMRRRQAQMGQNLQTIAAAQIIQLAQAVNAQDPQHRIRLTPSQLATLAKLGVEIESRARNVDMEGLVQPIVEIHVHETPEDPEVPA